MAIWVMTLESNSEGRFELEQEGTLKLNKYGAYYMLGALENTEDPKMKKIENVILEIIV